MKKPTIPEFVEMKRGLVEKHLSNYVETDTGCWESQGTRHGEGYRIVSISNGAQNGSYCYLLHRVAYYYHNNIDPTSLVVRHGCDNRCCINPAHLSLGTCADNSRDAVERGRIPKGVDHKLSKLTNKCVVSIKERLHSGEKHVQIAKDFSVSDRTINAINKGRTWRHIQLPEETLPCVQGCTEQLRLW